MINTAPVLEIDKSNLASFTDRHEDGWGVTWVLEGGGWTAYNSAFQPNPPVIFRTCLYTIPTVDDRQNAMELMINSIPDRFKVFAKLAKENKK